METGRQMPPNIGTCRQEFWNAIVDMFRKRMNNREPEQRKKIK
jgi:hypothetical protein